MTLCFFGSFDCMVPPLTATAAPAAAVGFQFNKSVFQQSMQMSFFPNIWSSPPHRHRPRKCRLSLRAGWVHMMCSTTT